MKIIKKLLKLFGFLFLAFVAFAIYLGVSEKQRLADSYLERQSISQQITNDRGTAVHELNTKKSSSELKVRHDSQKPKTKFDSPEQVKQKAAAEKKSDWRKAQGKSKIDDSTIYQISVPSLEHEPFATNFKGEPAELTIECRENKTSLYVDYHAFVSNSRISVTTRVDANKAKTSRWSSITSYKGVWKDSPIPLIKSMFNADRLVIRVTPFGENPQTRTFAISNIENEIKPIRKYCHW